MLTIGLTGGLGSGKSTVAQIFEVLGIPVYYADIAAKRMMNEDPGIKAAVINAFGDVYTDKKLDRSRLASIVFADAKKLEQLNSIVHPATLKDAAEWMTQQKAPYAIKEAALMFESGANRSLDYIIGVQAPLELRLQRVIIRDNISREEVMARINKQMDEDEKLALCDHIIVNDEQQPIIPQVLKLHEKFLAAAT